MQGVELHEETGQFVFEELVASVFPNLYLGVGRDKESDTPLVEDYALGLQKFIGTHHRVGVYLHEGRVFTHRGYAGPCGIVAQQYLVADAFGDLQVDGLVLFELPAYRLVSLVSRSFMRM